MKILVLNAGSNSLKFEVLEAKPDGDDRFGSVILAGSYDDVGKDHSSFSVGPNKSTGNKQAQKVRDHGHATELLFNWIEQDATEESGIRGLADVAAIGHRVVHGADLFAGPAELTQPSGEVRRSCALA
jgi:acetate kinase